MFALRTVGGFLASSGRTVVVWHMGSERIRNQPDVMHVAGNARRHGVSVAPRRVLAGALRGCSGGRGAPWLARILLSTLLAALPAGVAYAQPSWAPITNLADGAVAENAAYTSTTPAVTGTPTLTWTAEGADAAQFAIDGATGVLTMVARDFERPEDADGDNAYEVTVKATDTNAASATKAITVTVTDATEAPGKPDAPRVGALAGTVGAVGVIWTAPANTGPPIDGYDLQWREGTTGSWTDGPDGWNGTLAEIHGLTGDTAHQVRVRATHDEGDGTWSDPGDGTSTSATDFSGRFIRLPSTHAGSPFTVAMLFSESPETEQSEIQDRVEVTGGTVTDVRRILGHWELVITPNPAESVTIVPRALPCEFDTAICTLDGRSLVTVFSGLVPVHGVGNPFVAQFSRLPRVFATGEDFEVRVGFSHAVDMTPANFAGAWDVVNGEVVSAELVSSREGSVTVRPAGTGEVTLFLPAGRDCLLADATCSADDGLALEETLVGTVAAPSDALVAAFVTVPGKHNGPVRDERVRIQFSLPIDISPEDFATLAWVVGGGAAIRAERVEPGLWDIWFRPSAPDLDLTIALDGRLDCALTEGAICTAGEKQLAHGIEATIAAEVSRPNGTTDLLVGNRQVSGGQSQLGVNVSHFSSPTRFYLAQPFTTGSNVTGYDLNSVGLKTRLRFNSYRLGVELWSSGSDGRPGLPLTSLRRPSTVREGWNGFYAPLGTTLAPNTTYFIRLKYIGAYLLGTSALDAARAPGWGMDQVRCWSTFSAPNWELGCDASGTRRLLMEIRGNARDTRLGITNEPPSFEGTGLRLELRENAGANVAVGHPISATDPEGDQVLYTLEGADAGSFGIDPRSAQIRTQLGTDFNFEVRPAYEVTVVAEDPLRAAARATVVIALTDENEPPGRPAAPRVAAKPGTTDTLAVTWSPPVNTGPVIDAYDLRYAKSDLVWTEILDQTGTAAEIGSLDANTAYAVQVRARTDEGTSAWSESGQWVTGNTAPTFGADRVTRRVPENSAAGVAVGSVIAATDEDGDTLTYTLGGPDRAAFSVASTGQLSTIQGAVYDFEGKHRYALTLTADDGKVGGTDTVDVAILLDDVTDSGGGVLVSNLANGNTSSAFVCSHKFNCPWVLQGLMPGSSTGGYTITGVTIGVKTDTGFAELRFAVPRFVRIVRHSNRWSTYAQVRPTSIDATTAHYRVGSPGLHVDHDKTFAVEYYAVGQIVEALVTSDRGEETGAATGWSIDDTRDSGWYHDKPGIPAKMRIHGRVNMLQGLEYLDEGGGELPYWWDGGGYRVGASFPVYEPVSVTPFRDPTWFRGGLTHWIVNANNQRLVSIVPTAVDATSTVTFVDEGGLELSDADPNTAEFEVAVRFGARVVRLEVASADAMTHQTYYVKIERWRNRAPFFRGSANPSFPENSGAGYQVSTPDAIDRDGDPLEFSIEGSGTASFSVDGNGQLTTLGGVDYDYESRPEYGVILVADDGFGGRVRIVMRIGLDDVDEPPEKVAPPSVVAPPGVVGVLAVNWTEPATTGPPILGYDIEYRAGAANWIRLPRQPGTTVTLRTLMPGTDYFVQVRAVNDEGEGPFSDPASAKTNDGPALTLTVSPNPLDEGQTATVTAIVSMAMSARFTVTVDGPESDRYEFVGGNRTLSFATNATQSTGTVRIRAVANDVDDGDVDILLNGTPDMDGVSGGTVSVTVRDNDNPAVSIAAPRIALESGHLFENENSATEPDHLWTLTRSGEIADALVVKVTPSEITAANKGDFVDAAAENMEHSLTFGANVAMATYTPIVNDDVDEPHGAVTVTLVAGTGYRVAPSARSARVNVRDDDGARLVTFNIDPLGIAVSEGRTVELETVLETVRDSTFTESADIGRVYDLDALGGGLLLSLTTVDVEAVSAGANPDFTPLTRVAVPVPAAAFTRRGTGLRAVHGLPGVETMSDADDTEEMERFVVRLARGSTTPDSVDPATRANVANLLDGSNNVVELDGDDFIASVVELRDAPRLTLTVAPSDIVEGDNDRGEGTATVSATATSGLDVRYTLTVSAEPANSDRFEFADARRTLTFAANSTSSTGVVMLRSIHNDVDDGDIEVTLTATPSTLDVTPTTAVMTVVDDDPPKVSIAAPAGAVGGFLYESEAASEGNRAAWLLTREGILTEALAVSVNVTETGDFVEPDREGVQTVTFAAGSATAYFHAITGDMIPEDHGTVTVAIVAGGTTYEATAPDRASVDVRDDDGDLLEVTLEPRRDADLTRLQDGSVPSPYDATVSEGAPVQYRVVVTTIDDGTFTEATHVARLFGTSSFEIGVATDDGIAMEPDDYSSVDTTVTVSIAAFVPAGPAWRNVGGYVDDIATFRNDDDGPGMNGDDDPDELEEPFYLVLKRPDTLDGRIKLLARTNDLGRDGFFAVVTLIEGPPDGKLRICDAQGTCTEEKIRDVLTEGRIEMAYRGDWGTMCDDYWTNDDSGVACRQLGHFGVERTFGESILGAAARDVPIWLDDVQCTGTETRVFDCPRLGNAIGEHNCSVRHTEDVGVRCVSEEKSESNGDGYLIFRAPIEAASNQERSATLAVTAGTTVRYTARLSKMPEARDRPHADLRLDVSVSDPGVTVERTQFWWFGRDESEGGDFDEWTEAREVEVTVSRSAASNAQVDLVHTVTRTSYPSGEGSQPSDYPGEFRVTLAISAAGPPASARGASAEGSAAVAPGAGAASPEVASRGGPAAATLSGAPVEVETKAAAGAAAPAGGPPEGIRGLRAVSRPGALAVSWTGAGGATAYAVYWAEAGAGQHAGARRVVDGTSATLSGLVPETAYEVWVAALRDGLEGPSSAPIQGVPGQAENAPTLLAPRLADGSNPWEGRVELYYQGELADGSGYPGGWGTVCDDDFGPVDASVVCRLLGHGAARAALAGGAFGDGGGPTLLDDLRCDGSEAGLADCLPDGLAGIGRHDCGADEAAAAVCAPPASVRLTSRGPPALVDATVAGDRLTLRFDAPLDGMFRPVPRDFAVLVDGVPFRVAAVAVAGPLVRLTLAEPVGAGIRVSASYFAPALFPLAGLEGRQAAPFEHASVGNETGAPATGLASSARSIDERPPKPGRSAGLAAALRDALPAHEEPGMLETLDASGRRIVTLEGLAALTGLRRLNLSDNAVVDLWPLASLVHLEELDLSDNAIADLRPLAGLTALRRLDLSRNRTADLWPLADLVELRALGLAGNSVADLAPLGFLRDLVYLDVADNAIPDAAGLSAHVSLARLDLGGNPLLDTAPLDGLEALVWIRLPGQPLSSAEAFGRLTHVRWVWLGDVPVRVGGVTDNRGQPRAEGGAAGQRPHPWAL